MGDIRKRIKARRVVVTNTPTLIADNLHYKNTVIIKNLSGTPLFPDECVCVFLDGYEGTVSTTVGYPIGGCEVMTLGFQENSPQVPTHEIIQLYGICKVGEQAEIAILEEEWR